MEKKERKNPEEIAKDLEDVVLPEISEDDLTEALGGTSFDQASNFNCGCGC
jgi:hypothetical protein